MAEPFDQSQHNVRKRNHEAVEYQDERGRRHTVNIDELDAADRALVEQFGYKPVIPSTFSRLARACLLIGYFTPQ